MVKCFVPAVIAIGTATAFGDGGTVQFSKVVDNYRITVLTTPSPLRTGPIDMSFLVQEVRTGHVVPGAVIDVQLTNGLRGLCR